MKSFKLFLTVLFLAVLGLGNAWAVDPDYTLTPIAGSNNSYAGNCDVTISDITWNVTGNATMVPWRIGGKSITNTDRTVYSKTAYASAVDSIKLTIGAASSVTINKISLVHSTSSDFSNPTTIDAGGKTASTTYTFKPAAGFPKDSYFKFVFNVTIGGSNKYIEFTKVEIYNTPSGDPDPEPTCSTPTITFAGGAEVAKLTTDAAFTNAASVEFESVATGQTITYSVEAGKEGVATVNASTGEVTIVGAGEAKIYASVEADATYCEKNAYYTLTVTEPAFECGAGMTSYVFGDYTGFSSWTTTYEKKTLEYTEATVVLASANRSTATITDCPVTKGGAMEVKAKSGRKITAIHFEFEQWAAKAQTATLNYSTDGGASYLAFEPAISSTNFSLECASLPANTNAVKVTFSNSSNQIGLVSVCAAYTDPVAPSVATPELSVAAGTYEGTKNVKVSNYDAALSYYYTLDGTAPTSASTAYDHAAGIDVTASATLKVIAYDASSNASEVASVAYVIIPVYASLAELVAAGAPTTTGWTVKVTLTDVAITSFQPTKGVWVGDVELYGGVAYPNTWEVGGKLSGTLTCPWKLYSTTKELCPSDWTDLEYTAPDAPIADPEYASLAALIEGEGAPTAGGKNVKVTFTNDVITRITGDRKGIFFMVGEQEVEVYCSTTCPAEWTANGQVSGTLVEGSWKLYSGSTWEIVVADWTAFEYTAYVSHVTGVTFANGSVFAGKTLDLATLVEIAPADASNKNVSFAIVSGSEYITLSEGVVTGVAEGAAVVRVTTEDGSFTADATITVEAVSVWATTYTSNVTLTAQADTKCYKEKVKVNGEDTQYDALKMGTGSVAGSCEVTVPLGTTKLHFHAILWGGTTGNLVVKQNETELFNKAISADDGLASSSPYTLQNDPADDYYCIDFGSALTEATTLTFSCTNKRFAIYGVNVEKVEVELLSIAISGTATTTEYFAGDVFNPAGLVVTGTYNMGDPQVITEGIDWTFTPATLAVGTTSVSVVATVGEISSEAFVVNDLSVTVAPLHGDWLASEQGYANGVEVTTSNVKKAGETVAKITFDKAEGTNAPKYYTSGSAVRAYAKNTLKVAALNGSMNLTKIVLTFGTDDGTNAITANVGAYADGTWTGSASAVTFTVDGTSGNRRIAGVTVYYETLPMVEIRTGLTADDFGTMCQANDILYAEGATFFEIEKKNAIGLDLVEAEFPLVAGKPYLYQATDAEVNVVFGNEVATEVVEANGLVGRLSSATDVEYVPTDMYVIQKNALRKVAADKPIKFLADRAYINYDAVTDQAVEDDPMAAPRRRVTMGGLSADVVTSMDEIATEQGAVKFIENGVLYILRDGKRYNAQGQLVK